ncbi:TetR/AcrR family transcriptional regulator [Alkalibacterium psychrotolerans]
MPRKRRILRHHILDAAVNLMSEEGFERFTARRIAEQLNASTQPIYKEFKNMDDLKIHLTTHIEEFLKENIFYDGDTPLDVREVCTNYILFAKNEGTLFASLFMGRELCATTLHEFIYESLIEALNQNEFAEKQSRKDKEELLDIVWPAVHGYAILTAQGKYEKSSETLKRKINHILDHSYKVWQIELTA